MGYGNKSLNDWRDDALRIATEHGFTDASVAEDIALIHSEASEALEDHRKGHSPTEIWYEIPGGEITYDGNTYQVVPLRTDYPRRGNSTLNKPCGIPSEMADIIIRVLHFCGKHNIDIEQAVREKTYYNESRPLKHGKVL